MRDTFTGERLHSSAYRNPAPYDGKRVLVVGSGSSGMEIAYDLVTGGAATVWLAVRTPPNIMLRSLPRGLPADPVAVAMFHTPIRIADALTRRARRASLGDLSAFGLPIPDEGPFFRCAGGARCRRWWTWRSSTPIRDGSIEVVSTVARFDGEAVHLVDGRALQPDTVIYATGYRTGLEPLAGHLGLVNDRGAPVATGLTPAAKGLRFVGFTARPEFIGSVARQSRRVAGRIAKELTAADARVG